MCVSGGSCAEGHRRSIFSKETQDQMAEVAGSAPPLQEQESELSMGTTERS